MPTYRTVTALNGVTATTTSSKYYVGDAKRVYLQFRRADHNAGSSAFTVKGSFETLQLANGTSNDGFGYPTGGTGVTVTAYNMLIDNVTNTNAQTITRVNGKTLAANGDALLWLDPAVKVNWLEITVTETTDGTHSAWIMVESDENP